MIKFDYKAMSDRHKHMYIAYSVLDVLILSDDGSTDATVSEMNYRCRRLITDACDRCGISCPDIPPYDRTPGGNEVRVYYVKEIMRVFNLTHNDMNEIYSPLCTLPWETKSEI